MKNYIDLDRKFFRANLDALETQGYTSYSNHEPITWKDILDNKCTIILSEAGSGKTWELKYTAEKLNSQGKYSFFLKIENLAEINIEKAFVVGSLSKFESWARSDQIGYFFLDSIDEAKLKNVNLFERALKKLLHYDGFDPNRASVFISSRPVAWQAFTDQNLVSELFCTNVSENQVIVKDIDSSNSQKIYNPKKENPHLEILTLAPLSPEQIKKYAEAMHVENLDEFLREIENTGAEEFVLRPLDLDEQIKYWKKHKQLGKYHEIIDNNISLKLNENNLAHANNSGISPDSLRNGLERLAAVATLTNKTSIILPDETPDLFLKERSIDAKEVLPDWNNKDVNTLLNCPIFDEELYGTVGFHHKSVREYLTAKWFMYLLKERKNRKAVEGLFFTHIYGLELIKPTMRPVVAWVAGFNEAICIRAIKTDPKTLLEFGDPSLLNIDQRKKLLREFAARYKDRNYTGLRLNIREVKRLAHQELKNTIIELLEQFKDHDDVRDLLLRLIWQGSIKGCGKIVLEFALDSRMDPYTRACAIRAIGTGGTNLEKQELINDVLAHLERYNLIELEAVIQLFVPNLIHINELLLILQRVKTPTTRSPDYFSSMLELLPAHFDLNQSIKLIKGLKALLGTAPYRVNDDANISHRYSWLLGFAMKLIEKIFSSDSSISDTVILDILLYVKNGQDLELDYPNHKVKGIFKKLIDSNERLKHSLFWHEIKQKYLQIQKNEPIIFNLIYSLQLSKGIEELFFKDLSEKSKYLDKKISLLVLFYRYKTTLDHSLIEKIRIIINKNDKLQKLLNDQLAKSEAEEQLAIKYNEESSSYSQEQRKIKIDHSKITQAYNSDRVRRSSSDGIILPGEVIYLYNRLRILENDNRMQFTVTKSELLVPEFGVEVATAFRDYCINFWRQYRPVLNSENKDPNSIPLQVSIGLSGIAMEAQETNWFDKIIAADAKVAIRYALNELNAFPHWVQSLFEFKKKDVEQIIINEMEWELSTPSDNPQVYIIDRLSTSTGSFCRAFASDIVKCIIKIKSFRSIIVLSKIITFVLSNYFELPKSFLNHVKKQCREGGTDAVKAIWFSTWFCLDGKGALKEFQKWIKEDEGADESRVSKVLNYLVGDRSLFRGSNRHSFLNSSVLLELIKIAFVYIDQKNDIQHFGVYTPTARDNAQRDRNALIEILRNIPGRDTYTALKTLSKYFKSKKLYFLKDQMENFAENRAMTDLRLSVYLPKDIVDFAREVEITPKTEFDLFQVAISRLDDFRTECEEDDYSMATVYRRIQTETELRNAIINALEKTSRGKFTLSSENENADKKRTDIKFHCNGDITVPVELKIAENWALEILKKGIKDQLVKNYMRSSSHGIFLLVYQGKKPPRWKCPIANNTFSFNELLAEMKKEALTLQRTNSSIDGLEIIGIDLTKRGCK